MSRKDQLVTLMEEVGHGRVLTIGVWDDWACVQTRVVARPKDRDIAWFSKSEALQIGKALVKWAGESDEP